MEDKYQVRTEKEIIARLAKASNLVSKYLNKGDDGLYLVWRTVEKELKWVLGIGRYGINSKTKSGRV